MNCATTETMSPVSIEPYRYTTRPKWDTCFDASLLPQNTHSFFKDCARTYRRIFDNTTRLSISTYEFRHFGPKSVIRWLWIDCEKLREFGTYLQMFVPCYYLNINVLQLFVTPSSTKTIAGFENRLLVSGSPNDLTAPVFCWRRDPERADQ